MNTDMLYMGQRITDMTRDELIEALIEMGKQYQSRLDDNSHTIALWDMCRKARKAGGQ